MSRNRTVLSLREIAIASQWVRASIPNMLRNVCTFETSKLDSFSITPDM